MRCDFINLTGQRFNLLTILGYEKTRRNTAGDSLVDWICLCDCGNTNKSKKKIPKP